MAALAHPFPKGFRYSDSYGPNPRLKSLPKEKRQLETSISINRNL